MKASFRTNESEDVKIRTKTKKTVYTPGAGKANGNGHKADWLKPPPLIDAIAPMAGMAAQAVCEVGPGIARKLAELLPSRNPFTEEDAKHKAEDKARREMLLRRIDDLKFGIRRNNISLPDKRWITDDTWSMRLSATGFALGYLVITLSSLAGGAYMAKEALGDDGVVRGLALGAGLCWMPLVFKRLLSSPFARWSQAVEGWALTAAMVASGFFVWEFALMFPLDVAPPEVPGTGGRWGPAPVEPEPVLEEGGREPSTTRLFASFAVLETAASFSLAAWFKEATAARKHKLEIEIEKENRQFKSEIEAARLEIAVIDGHQAVRKARQAQGEGMSDTISKIIEWLKSR